MGSQALFEERLAGLREAFVAGLPGRLAAMRAALATEDREAVRHEAHRLAGTGVSYGLPELTTWGRAVEKLCRQEAQEQQITRALDELDEMLTQLSPVSATG